jgi:hypothetical protein
MNMIHNCFREPHAHVIRTAFLVGKHEGLKCLIGTVFELNSIRLYYSGKKMIRLDYWSIICNNFLHYRLIVFFFHISSRSPGQGSQLAVIL